MKVDAFYGRNSSDEQAEKGTIQAQVDFAEKYFDLHEIKNYEMYLDEGTSGTIALGKREESARMLADVKGGKIKTVYVYRLDRLARSVKHTLDTYEFLEEHGVRLVSMTESFDTGTPSGKFFMTLLASIAALERDTILERTQMGKDRNARLGKWVSGAPPFGYRIGDDGKLFVFEPEAETVRLIFKLYTEDMSMIEIAKYLNAKSVPTPAMSKGIKNQSTGKWHAGHISIILRSEAYTGIYNYLQRSKKKRDTIEVDVPMIIDIETFVDIQKKIISNSDTARGKKGRSYLLRGLIYCGHCGRAMIGTSGGSTGRKSYYRCTGALDQGQGKRCDAKLISAKKIENAVWKDMLEIIKYPEKFKKYIDESISEIKKYSSDHNNEFLQLEEAILLKQKARGKILSLITKGIITEEEAEQELKNLSIEIRSLNSRKDFLFEQKDNSKAAEVTVINSQIILDKLKDNISIIETDENKMNIIHILCKRIEVFTVIEENKKIRNKAHLKYKIGGSVELGISGDAEV